MAKTAAPKRPPKKPKEVSQKQRFIDAAKKAGADESGKLFERAIGKLVPAKQGKPVTT